MIHHRFFSICILLIGVFGTGSVGFADEKNASVIFFNSESMLAAAIKAKPLIEAENYKLIALQREAPGMAEVHARDTDVIVVMDGTASFVTGGIVIEGKNTDKDEIRGSAITGGDTRKLATGDVVIVPNGTPHWFKEVSVPFLYYVVKVSQGNAKSGGNSLERNIESPESGPAQ